MSMVNEIVTGAARPAHVVPPPRENVINMPEIERTMGANSDAYKIMAYIDSRYTQYLPDQAYYMLAFNEMRQFLTFENSQVIMSNHQLYKKLDKVDPNRALAMATIMHAAWGSQNLRSNSKYKAVVEAYRSIFRRFPSEPCPGLNLETRIRLYYETAGDRRRKKRRQKDNSPSQQQVDDNDEASRAKRLCTSDRATQVDDTVESVAPTRPSVDTISESLEMHRQRQEYDAKRMDSLATLIDKITHIETSQKDIREDLKRLQQDFTKQVQDSPLFIQIQQQFDRVNHRIDVVSRHIANS